MRTPLGYAVPQVLFEELKKRIPAEGSPDDVKRMRAALDTCIAEFETACTTANTTLQAAIERLDRTEYDRLLKKRDELEKAPLPPGKLDNPEATAELQRVNTQISDNGVEFAIRKFTYEWHNKRLEAAQKLAACLAALDRPSPVWKMLCELVFVQASNPFGSKVDHVADYLGYGYPYELFVWVSDKYPELTRDLGMTILSTPNGGLVCMDGELGAILEEYAVAFSALIHDRVASERSNYAKLSRCRDEQAIIELLNNYGRQFHQFHRRGIALMDKTNQRLWDAATAAKRENLAHALKQAYLVSIVPDVAKRQWLERSTKELELLRARLDSQSVAAFDHVLSDYHEGLMKARMDAVALILRIRSELAAPQPDWTLLRSLHGELWRKIYASQKIALAKLEAIPEVGEKIVTYMNEDAREEIRAEPKGSWLDSMPEGRAAW